MAGLITFNKVRVPINSDPYALTADLKLMAESANVLIPVASQSERDLLVTNGQVVVGTTVIRKDLSGVPFEVWDGSLWWLRFGDTGWLTVTVYGNGFTAYTGAPWDGIKYRLTNGVFTVSGPAINTGTWTSGLAICNIPSPYRPSRQIPGMNANFSTAGDALVIPAGTNTTVNIYGQWMLP